MVQKFYLHDAATTVAGTLPVARQGTFNATTLTATGAATNRAMTPTVGSAQVGATLATAANTTVQTGWLRRFVSPPLAAQVLTQTWTGGVAGLTSNSNSAYQLRHSFYLWRPSTGALVFMLDDGNDFSPTNAGAATTETGFVGTLATSGTPTVVDGDVLIIEVYGFIGAQGMSTSYTWTFDYDGTTDPVDNTAIASAASYILASADVSLWLPRSNPRTISQAVARASLW